MCEFAIDYFGQRLEYFSAYLMNRGSKKWEWLARTQRRHAFRAWRKHLIHRARFLSD